MQTYLLGIHQPVGAVPDPETLEPVMRRLGEITGKWEAEGSLIFTGGLFPPGSSTVIRLRDDDILLTDGPFTEGKEYLGGLWIIRVADLDEALAHGRQITEVTTLPIEVRPFQG